MGYVKRIVCLANSYKRPNGRCFAGKEVLADGFGDWIRPVSIRSTAEVSFAEYRYENNTSPKLLDIIGIPLLNPDPRHHQTENHVIDTGRWCKLGLLPWDRLEELRDEVASLWINNDHTKGPGLYDCISQTDALVLHDSLVLIKPENFNVEVDKHYWTGKKTYRASFDYNDTHYNLSLTDPVARDVYAGKEEGTYSLTDLYLCVSLTEPYEHDDRCHKVVAAIIKNPPL
jgi:hypothetical protein